MSKTLPRLALAVCLAAAFTATLTPAGDDLSPFSLGLFRAPRALADSLGNVAMFAPIGAALRAIGLGTLAASALGAAISLAIELTQMVIPGREPGLTDLVTNTAGAALGASLIPHARAWLSARPAAAPFRPIAAAALACAVWLATGYLLAPSFLSTTYWGQWTPHLNSMEPYRGRVLEARVGSEQVPSDRVERSEELRQQLAEQQPIDVRFIVGPVPRRISDIFSISDPIGRRVLLVAALQEDLVFRYRTRSADWRLDQPDIRLTRALAHLSPGSEARISVTHQSETLCIEVASQRACGLGYGLGDGWSLFVHPTALSDPWRRVLQAIWMAAIMVPVGFWAAADKRTAAALAIVTAGLVLVPASTHALPARWYEWVGVASGIAAGHVAGRATRHLLSVA